MEHVTPHKLREHDAREWYSEHCLGEKRSIDVPASIAYANVVYLPPRTPSRGERHAEYVTPILSLTLSSSSSFAALEASRPDCTQTPQPRDASSATARNGSKRKDQAKDTESREEAAAHRPPPHLVRMIAAMTKWPAKLMERHTFIVGPHSSARNATAR
jgi:hypothetical protein